MKKGWKIALISVGSLLGVVVIAVSVVLWLVFTPSQLTKIVNRVAGDYVLCESHFDKVDLTLFKTFPDAGLKIDNVYLVNAVDGALCDTVAHIGSLTLGVDVKAFMKENKVIVHQVLVDDVQACLYIGSDGQSNFDIFPKGDEDTTSSTFSLDSLPEMNLKRVSISNLCAQLQNDKNGLYAEATDLDLNVKGTLTAGLVDADLDLQTDKMMLTTVDSNGKTQIYAVLDEPTIALKADGNLDKVKGQLKMNLKKGRFNDMINETLQASKHDLLSLTVPFEADLQQMLFTLHDDSRLKLDDYALTLGGTLQLASDRQPMEIHAALATDDEWQAEPLLAILPAEYTTWKKGMDLDAKLKLEATAHGTLTDTTMPLIAAKVLLADGRFSYPQALPCKVTRINADLQADLDLGKGGVSKGRVNSLRAHALNTDLTLDGNIGDLLGDMRIDANLKAHGPLADAEPFLPDTLKLSAAGKADIKAKVGFKLSQLSKMALEQMTADATVKLKDLDFTLDSLHAEAPELNLALRMPATAHKGRLADANITGSGKWIVENGSLKAELVNAAIDAGINNPLKEQIAAAFNIRVGETEANIDSMMVSLESLQLKGSLRLDSTQQNILRQYNPDVDVNLHGAVLYMPSLPDAVRLSQFSLAYSPKGANLRTAEVKLGHSDFQLYGTVDNLEKWLDHEDILRADLNFTSGYSDVDQLISLISGIGSDPDSLEQMRQEDNVPAEANPFIVPKDVDLTLHTHIKRCVAFGNDLNDLAGAVTINDGTAILDQIGFVCKAATMQLSALYRSPRPNNLFVALDFHLLDIQIDELLDMIPTVDTLVPMLAAFSGNANFHLAAETFLDARYQPKMSSLLGSAAISGRDLTVMDNNTIAQIAKLMQFKSWKDKDNKIRIDSLDVEMTCFRKEIEVFPFLLNIGKYQLCASGKHTLDNQCGYHVELLKNPLLAKVGVDVRGDLSSPKISLGQVRYADLYRPDKQGVVEKQTLELKRKIKQALEANVR